MPRTLSANATANYLKLGARSRIFLAIPGAGKYWSTDAQGDYEDKIVSIGNITNRIDHFGGMSIISDCEVRIIKAGNANIETFHQSAVINPADEIPIKGAGRLLNTGGYGDTYLSVRSGTSGTLTSNAVVVGQRYNTATVEYNVYRAYMQFTIPAALTSCEDAFIRFTGVNDESVTDFDIYVYQGEWSALSDDIFEEFDGWQAGATVYDGTRLNEILNTSDYIDGENFIRLNRSGREVIEAAAGGTVRFMMVSAEDVNNSTPVGKELVRFERSDIQLTPTLEIQYNTLPLDNERATIYLAFEDDTGALPATVDLMQAIWSGVVDSYSIDQKILTIKLKHDDMKRNQLFPLDLITTDDFPNSPVDNIGKPYPVVYGDAFQGSRTHKIGIGSEFSGASINPLSGVRDYFPYPVIEPGDADHESPMEILISKTQLKDTVDGFPAFYSGSMKGFTRFFCNISSDKDNGYSYVEATPKGHPNQSNSDVFPAEPNAYELDFLGDAISIIPNSVYTSIDVTNPELAYAVSGPMVMSESTSLVQFAFPNIGAAGEIKKVEVSFYLVDNNSGSPLNEIFLKVLEKPTQWRQIERTDGITSNFDGTTSNFASAASNFSTAGIASNDMIIITTGDNEGRYRVKSVVDANNIRTETQPDEAETGQTFHILQAGAVLKTVDGGNAIYNTGTRIINITSLDAGDMDWELATKLIQLQVDAGHSPVLDFEIYNFQIRYFTTSEIITTVFMDSKGRKDGSSNLIEIPSKVIKDIAENESTLTSGDINTASFTGADSILAAWIFSFSVWEKQEKLFNFRQEKGFMDRLGKQCKSTILFDADGQLKINAFDVTANFPNSGTDIPGNLDIVELDGSPSSGSLTRNPIIPGSFKPLVQIETDQVKNDFKLKYRLNYGTGEYEELIYMDNGLGVSGSVTTNMTEGNLENSQTLTELKKLCADSFNNINATNAITIEAWAISDEATASKLLQAYIEWFTIRRYVCEFRTKRNAIQWELGDFCNIRTQDIIDRRGDERTERGKWKIFEISPALIKMEWAIKAIQVD